MIFAWSLSCNCSHLFAHFRPFKFTPPIPTDESVALVEGFALEEIEKLGYANRTDETKIDGLLEIISYPSTDIAGSKNFDGIRGIGNIGLSPAPLVKPFVEDQPFELVLTNRERRLLAGLSEIEDLQEARGENVDDLQEQQDGASPSSSVFHCSGILDSVPEIVDHSDDSVSCTTFKSRDVVFDDSSVASPILPILPDIGRCYRGQFPGGAGYSDTIQDICHSDEDKQRKFHFTRNQLQDQQQEVAEYQDQGPFSPLSSSIQHQQSTSPFPLSALSAYDQDPIGFFPLSFGSQTERLSIDPIGPGVYPPDNDEERTRTLQPDYDDKYNAASGEVQDVRDKDNPENVCSFLQYFVPKADPSTATPACKRRRLEDSTVTAIATREFLDDHLTLRNKPVMHDFPIAIPTAIIPQAISASPPRNVPPEFLDAHTIRLPDSWDPRAASHWYLANMSVIQKRALLRALRTPECRVHLVERYTLDGVDIIVDPDTAVLFAPLLALPSQVEGLSNHVLRASWRYTHILIILEAFPSGEALTADGGDRNSTHSVKLTPNAFSPPTLKAVKKLRRLLNIADGFGSKNAGCKIHWAFANNVGEAAQFVRVFGDLAEERGLMESRHALWGDRGWLQTDEHEVCPRIVLLLVCYPVRLRLPSLIGRS